MENQANASSTTTTTQQDPESSQSSSVSSTRSSRSSTQRKSILKTSEKTTTTTTANSKATSRANAKKENSSASSSSIPSPSPSSNSNSDHISVTPSVSFADQTPHESEVKKSPVRTRTTRQSLTKANNTNAATPNANSSQNGKQTTRTPNGRNSKNNKKQEEQQIISSVEIKEEEEKEQLAKKEEDTSKKKKSPVKKTPAKEEEEEPVVKFFCPNDENTLDGFNNKEDSNSVISNDETNLEENTNTASSNKKSSIKITKLTKKFVQEASVAPPNSNTESSNNTQSNDGLETGDDATNQPGGEQNGEDEEQSQNSGDQFKKKRRRRTSLLMHDSSGGQISAANLFVYKWPQTESESAKSDSTDAAATSEQPENYILQEQFSEYLGIKSFKRKFPDLFRRLIDVKEREYLKENKVVTETQCDLGLTALKLNECLDIMADNYPDKYKELNDLLYEKRRKNYMKNIDAHLNELDTTLTATNASGAVATPATTATASRPRPGRVAMSEADRMKEMIKKAMKSVSNYNLQLQKEKKEERNLYFDLQTMRIQKPLGQMNRNIQVKYVNPNGQYPVSVLPGQYQNYYKKYTSDELKYLPLNTVVYAPPVPAPLLFEEWKQQLNQPANQSKPYENGTKYESSDDETVNDRMDSYVEQQTPQQISKPKLPQSNKIANILANSSLNNSANNTPSSFRITCSAAPTVANLISGKQVASSASTTPNVLPKKVITPIYKECNVCGKTSQINAGASVDQFMIGCSSCSRYSHPNCLELNPSLVNWQCIMQYDWQCMECKRCTKCNNPHDEDKMMFCDRCDRGYHTYCVGLKEVPTGTWLCKTCDGPLTTNENENLMSLVNSPSKQKLALLKPRLNASLNESLNTTPSSTGVRTGKRGRPPGSLNKPKDPNSPKKQAKSLVKKMKMDSSLIGNGITRDEESIDGYGDMDDELSNNISIENINNLINISINDRLVHSNY